MGRSRVSLAVEHFGEQRLQLFETASADPPGELPVDLILHYRGIGDELSPTPREPHHNCAAVFLVRHALDVAASLEIRNDLPGCLLRHTGALPEHGGASPLRIEMRQECNVRDAKAGVAPRVEVGEGSVGVKTLGAQQQPAEGLLVRTPSVRGCSFGQRT